MDQKSLFKRELTSILTAGGILYTIAENDEAIDELLKETALADKAPNFTLYVSEVTKDTPEEEIDSESLDREFVENYKNIPEKLHFYRVDTLPTVKKLIDIDSQVEELQRPEIYNNPHFDKEARIARIQEIFGQLPTATQVVTVNWIKDIHIYSQFEYLADDLSKYKEPKTLFPDPDQEPFSPERERREKIKKIQTAREIRIHLAHQLEGLIQTPDKHDDMKDLRDKFEDIANQLKPYIKGATDEIIGYIYTYKTLPEGAKLPKWIGDNITEASRFMIWCNMKEAAITKCIAGIEKIKPGHRPSQPQLTGSIYDILKNYPKK